MAVQVHIMVSFAIMQLPDVSSQITEIENAISGIGGEIRADQNTLMQALGPQVLDQINSTLNGETHQQYMYCTTFVLTIACILLKTLAALTHAILECLHCRSNVLSHILLSVEVTPRIQQANDTFVGITNTLNDIVGPVSVGKRADGVRTFRPSGFGLPIDITMSDTSSTKPFCGLPAC